MTTLSACTLVRNALKLKYPLEASIKTYYPISDEVVIAFDPTSEDGTESYIRDLVRRYPKVRAIPSAWDLTNHVQGTEITIQSNIAFEACTSDWILYVQADEAIHEGDHAAIRAMLEQRDLNGVLFDRHSFLGGLDHEIPEYFARGLLRIIRNGQGLVVQDGMTLGYFQGGRPLLARTAFRMYNYSRMGSREEVLLRSRSRDNFHIATQQGIEENLRGEFTQKVVPFELKDHPAPIREFYGGRTEPTTRNPQNPFQSPVTLALLLGPGEREHLGPFFWQFREWPGDIVVMDDMTIDGASSVLNAILAKILKFAPDRITILREPLNGDFGKARNRLRQAARAPWILTSAPDERWDPGLLRGMPDLICQLERDGKRICGFPRANFIDGILVNDVPASEWSESELLGAVGRVAWPPGNPDPQYRLMKKDEAWVGKIHEQPAGLSTHPDQVVVLRDFWILHNKSLRRQREQDTFYRSLGQRRGMPQVPASEGDPPTFRETTLQEVVSRLPARPLTVVETGTLRDPSPSARSSDGWSTYCLAEILAKRGVDRSMVYSIDNSPESIRVSKGTVPDALHPWVTWITADSVEGIRDLPVDAIDLLYLDSSDDSAKILAEFEAALPKLKPESIVVVDDTGPELGHPNGNGTMVLPAARKKGWRIERRDTDRCHMAILSRRAE